MVLRPLFCLVQCHQLNRSAILHFEFKKSFSSLWVWNNRNCDKRFQANLNSAPFNASARIHKHTWFFCGLSDLIAMWKQLPTCGVSPVSGTQSALRCVYICTCIQKRCLENRNSELNWNAEFAYYSYVPCLKFLNPYLIIRYIYCVTISVLFPYPQCTVLASFTSCCCFVSARPTSARCWKINGSWVLNIVVMIYTLHLVLILYYLDSLRTEWLSTTYVVAYTYLSVLLFLNGPYV